MSKKVSLVCPDYSPDFQFTLFASDYFPDYPPDFQFSLCFSDFPCGTLKPTIFPGFLDFPGLSELCQNLMISGRKS